MHACMQSTSDAWFVPTHLSLIQVAAGATILRVRACRQGWGGLGFWVNTAGDSPDWAAHFRDASAANLTYLKIDGGDHPCAATALAKVRSPGSRHTAVIPAWTPRAPLPSALHHACGLAGAGAADGRRAQHWAWTSG
jgi:hypothetical protein|eukprot:COSAG01_NODE_3367_length_6187_cov_26.119087_7_plen_137_part_00